MSECDQREETLFAAALNLPECERAAYLERASPDDPPLRARVHSLVQAFERAGHFLNEPAVPSTPFEPVGRVPACGAECLYPGPSEKPGDQIGRYRILKQLGEGGCGIVYLAYQE